MWLFLGGYQHQVLRAVGCFKNPVLIRNPIILNVHGLFSGRLVKIINWWITSRIPTICQRWEQTSRLVFGRITFSFNGFVPCFWYPWYPKFDEIRILPKGRQAIIWSRKCMDSNSHDLLVFVKISWGVTVSNTAQGRLWWWKRLSHLNRNSWCLMFFLVDLPSGSSSQMRGRICGRFCEFTHHWFSWSRWGCCSFGGEWFRHNYPPEV